MHAVYDSDRSNLFGVFADVRRVRVRVRLRRLVLEAGCPWKTSAGGIDRCARCGGAAKQDLPFEKPEYKHEHDCIWLELEREAN